MPQAEPVRVDIPSGLSDLEIFGQLCVSEAGTILGDLWPDAPRKFGAIF